MALGAFGNLADLRAWWVVLRQALRMAPHPAARLLRPRIPTRPALTLGLAALAAATLYAMLTGVLVFRLEDALGMAAAVNAAVGPDGAPWPGFLPAVQRMILVFSSIAVLGLLPPVA